MKRILSMLLALAMVLSILPATPVAHAATSGKCGENLTWTMDTAGTLVISGSGAMYDYSNRSAPWYSAGVTFRRIILEEGVTYVGRYAFCADYGTVYLTVIPSTLTSIGRDAFMCGSRCVILGSETIASSLNTYDSGQYLLFHTNSVLVREGISYGSYVRNGRSNTSTARFNGEKYTVFSTCSTHSYTAVQVAGVERLQCSSCLAVVDVPKVESGACGENITWVLDEDGVLTISGQGAMPLYNSYPWSGHKDEVKKLVIEEGVTAFHSSAFKGYEQLTEVVIPNTFTALPTYAFSDCTALTKVTLPNTIATIGDSAFYGCTALVELDIPQSLTDIGAGAFRECSALTEVTIPAGVAALKKQAFLGCTGLTKVTFSEGLTTIGESAFFGCSSLCSVAFPASLTTIDDTAFYGCKGMTELDLPAGVTSMGYRAFAACTGLKELIIPPGITAIEDGVFYGCSGVTSVQLHDGITSIGADSLSGLAIEQIVLPKNLTALGAQAFANCLSLKEIVIPEGVTVIENATFHSCRALTGITLPAGITGIGDYSFYSCEKLTDVYYGGTQAQWEAITVGDGNAPLRNATVHITEPVTGLGIYNSPEKRSYLVGEALDTTGLVLNVTYGDGTSRKITEGFTVSGFDSTTVGKKNITVTYEGFTVTFAVTVTARGSCGETITWVLDENGVLTISGEGGMTDYIDTGDTPWYALQRSIQRIVIEEGVTSIGRRAFEECLKATSVDIPEGITAIGDYAFANCLELTEIEIPNSVAAMGAGVFESCESITAIRIPDSVTSIGETMFLGCIALTEVEIPAAVTSIGDHAFGQCLALKKLHIPASVTHIGEYVFVICPELEQITVDPDNQHFCDDNGVLFDKDKSVLICYPGGKTGSYAIPDTVERIGSNAFSICAGLTELMIPESVIAVDDHAFEECPALTDVYFTGTEAQREAISFGEGNEELTDATWYYPTICGAAGSLIWILEDGTLTISGSGAMPDFEESAPWAKYADSITRVVVGDGITAIADNAFRDCVALTSVSLPGSLLRIGNYAFYGTGLSSVTLPDGLQSIGLWAFGNCDRLSTVTVPKTVTVLGAGAFAACDKLVAIYVAGQNPNYTHQNGVLYDKAQTQLLQVPGDYSSSLTIPATVTAIGMNAFRDCHGLGKLTVPATVTAIGDAAFYGSSFTEVTILGQVDYLRFATFSECKRLKKVTLPADLTAIDSSTFSGCTALEEVFFRGTQTQWQQVNIPGGNDAVENAIIHYGTGEHIWDEGEVTVQPTCIAKGEVLYTCSCGTEKTEVVLESDSHVYDNTCDGDCNLCRATRTAPHAFDNDCDEVCNFCGFTRTVEHVYNNENSHNCAVCRRPLAPVAASVTHDTVILAARADHQYSLDGVTWQSSNVFTGLEAQREYTFYQRYAADEAVYCSPASEALTVTTARHPGDINNDKAVNNDDVLYLLWHTLFPADYPLDGGVADVNRDGFVANDDVLYLLWHTLFPADYPLPPEAK